MRLTIRSVKNRTECESAAADFGRKTTQTSDIRLFHKPRLDDLLTTPITPDAASELLNILAGRESRGATVVTSQFDPEDWYKSLHDAVIAESILNRIVSTSELIQLDGPNMRRHTHAGQEGTTTG